MGPGSRHLTGSAFGIALLLVCGCTSSDPAVTEPSAASSPRITSEPATPGANEASPEPTVPTPHPISVPALAAADHRGDRLRLGAVREQTARFTSYDVTFRARTTTDQSTRTLSISGVLNVPRGRGPFPAVVLAHGYIDPAVYVRGQGMTRERGYLADRGFVAMHVDYRNHAESGDDPRVATAVRLDYSADVIAAVRALRASPEVPVDTQRMGLIGRSMGGGVVMKAMIAQPGLVQAGVAWASVSSLEAENFRHFNADDPADAAERQRLSQRHGLPDENPRFWQGISARPHLDRITEPVLLVHGRFDETCPPRWARTTQAVMARAGVDSELAWYYDGHAFGPAFNAAMDRTISFLHREMDR